MAIIRPRFQQGGSNPLHPLHFCLCAFTSYQLPTPLDAPRSLKPPYPRSNRGRQSVRMHASVEVPRPSGVGVCSFCIPKTLEYATLWALTPLGKGSRGKASPSWLSQPRICSSRYGNLPRRDVRQWLSRTYWPIADGRTLDSAPPACQ